MITFTSCSCCGLSHLALEPHELERPTEAGSTHYAVCPTTQRRILFRYGGAAKLNVPPLSGLALHQKGLT